MVTSTGNGNLADILSSEPSCDRVPLRERLRQATRQIESRLIMEALERNRWNRRRTAEALKISYRSLMYKMKRCNLRDGDVAGAEGTE